MKMMKKLATLLLAICLVVPCFSMVSFAADGKIMFDDPSAKVGETLEFNLVIEKTSGTMGKIEIVMSYDTEYLKFKSGEGIVEGTSGELTFTGDVTNETGSRKEVAMQFDVLKEGTTKLTIKSSTIKDVSGNVRNYTEGSSTITIAAGEGTTVTEPVTDNGDGENVTGAISADAIEVNGKPYTISNTIPENEIPEGYEAAKLEYDLVEYNVVYSEEFGLYLAYMIGADNVGGFFMYVEDDATFAPYEEISISDNVRIALLSDVSEIVLPSEYGSTEVLLGEHEFPAWRNEEYPDFIILYAINNSGEESLYQLDNAEGTYQRFNAPEVVSEEIDDTFIGKLSDLLQNHLDYVILGTGLGFILFVIIIVVLSVKLYNRNAELDEIYDEYGIDEEDEDDSEDDDYDEDDEDYDDDDTDGDREMEMLVQAGMMEVFPEEDDEEASEEESVEEMVVEPTTEPTSNTVEIPIERVVEKISESEDTLGEALAKQKEAAKEEKDEYFDDDDDILDNFSMDFIDLDD